MWWALSHAFLHTCFPAIRNFKSLARATVVPPATWKKEKTNCLCCFSEHSPQNDVLACLKSPKLIFSEHFNGQHHSFWAAHIWSSLSTFALLLECLPLTCEVGVEESWNWIQKSMTSMNHSSFGFDYQETGDSLLSSVSLDGIFHHSWKKIALMLFDNYLVCWWCKRFLAITFIFHFRQDILCACIPHRLLWKAFL